jgi:hypothetical protein
MSEQKALSKDEIVLFKFLNKKFKEHKRKDEFFRYVQLGLKLVGLNPKDVQYYFDLFVNNYREDGKYENLKVDELKGAKDFKAQRIINVNAKNYSRNKLPFKGSNVEGFWETDLKGVDYYVITSYKWYPIYLYKEGVWYKTLNSYSRATGKQISLSNPIQYDDTLNQLVVMVTKDEMELLRRYAKLDDIIKHKKNKLVQDKELYTNKEKTIKNSEWIEPNATPIKIKFKIKDIEEREDNAIVKVEVVDVVKRLNNKSLPTPENYLKGEIPNVNKEKVEQRIESELYNNFREYFGSSDIESPIKFEFTHSKKS